MLVLMRRVGERIVIGSDITLEVVAIEQRHGRLTVRLGATAPRDVKIVRQECLPVDHPLQKLPDQSS